MNHLALKPASSRCFMCIRAQLDYVHLYPLRTLLRLLKSNPISSNPRLPPPLPPSSIPPHLRTCCHTHKTHTHAAQILLLVIHVVGLLLSLLWIYAHKTPWTLLPQDHSQWYLGKDSVSAWGEHARVGSKWGSERWLRGSEESGVNLYAQTTSHSLSMSVMWIIGGQFKRFFLALLHKDTFRGGEFYAFQPCICVVY